MHESAHCINLQRADFYIRMLNLLQYITQYVIIIHAKIYSKTEVFAMNMTDTEFVKKYRVRTC